MDWQQPVALVIVAAAVYGLAWRNWRTRSRKFSFERDTHCGCPSPAQDAAHSSIIFHARKGDRPTITVKNRH